MKLTKILALVLCLCMVVSMFAACGDNTGTNSDQGGQQGGYDDNSQYTDEKGELVNIGSPTTMKVTPEEVGELKNPVVRGIEAWMSDGRLEEHVNWKKELYGLEYKYDKCTGDELMARWVSAFVAGDSYDVLWINSGNFPTVAQKGLLQPLEKVMPVHDENYFVQSVTDAFTWKGRVYGVNAHGGLDAYGIHYNATLLENAGETTPMELYEAGNWNWTTFETLVKSMHNVTGDGNDVYGFGGADSGFVGSAIVSNGGSVITYTNTGADITIGNKNAMTAVDWASKINTDYMLVNGARTAFTSGQMALYYERGGQRNAIRLANDTYEFGWVPFPKGPSGTGEQTGSGSAWGIGKGAKNIAGAMAWIGADCYYDEYWKEPYRGPNETRTAEEYALEAKASNDIRMDNFGGFGISLYSMLEAASSKGSAAAIEQYKPQFQAKVDEMLGIKEEVGGVTFEAQGVITFESTDNYPFVNVIGDDKMTYATAEAPSLNIDLSGTTEFGAILHTKPEMYSLQKGGQYKVTFKLYCDVDPGKETFAVAARTTDNLAGDPTFGLTWLELKAGEAVDVETYINVTDSYQGDLAIVLLGSATEANPNLNIVIDNFNVELVVG